LSIESQVLKEIVRSPIPVSIQYIAKRINVGWGTAIRYALELMAAGKIEGMKTTKSWVFWARKEVEA